MTGPEHQERAAQLLNLVDAIRNRRNHNMLGDTDIPGLVAEAQAHAALAHNALLASLSANRFLLDKAWETALGVTV